MKQTLTLLTALLITPLAVLHAADAPAPKKPRRASSGLTAGVMEISFDAIRARDVRLALLCRSGEPCVDELEIFSPGKPGNVALATAGAKATASSCFADNRSHKIEHLNDGQYGNARSWIPAAGNLRGWAQISLPAVTEINRVAFSRDRTGHFQDRVDQDIEVQVSLDGQKWQTVRRIEAAALRDPKRMPHESPKAHAQRLAGMVRSMALREECLALAAKLRDEESQAGLTALLELDRERRHWLARLAVEFNPPALRRALADLGNAPADLDAKLAAWERRLPALREALEDGDSKAIRQAIPQAMRDAERLFAFGRDLLLANPLLDAKELVCLSRQIKGARSNLYWDWGQRYGFTVNWACDFRPKSPPVNSFWQDEIIAVPTKAGGAALRTVFKPAFGRMVQHLELHYDADRLLFSYPDEAGAFQVFEMKLDGGGLRQMTKDTPADVDNGDACYLPDGRILFNSTRGFHAVPCEDGSSYVTGLCLYDPARDTTRMLTFDQESNWHPGVLNNGRVLYTRYEYANISHQFARMLFHMNPDGTGQVEYYGSNSYWPNSIFHARAIPGHPTMVAGIVCGHHGPNKMGKLILFDPARGRKETEGAVQAIPGHGKKVERIVEDELYGNEWPKFVHPWPLSEKYFLVSGRLSAEQEEFAIYLVDVFDNITEVCRIPGKSLFDPIPLKKRPRPPVIPDRVNLAAKEATVYLQDVYHGPGLAGVPRGSVKQLRLFSYSYYYRHGGAGKQGFSYGHLATTGEDGPWEPRYLLGTVPVAEDGSAHFKIPANLPVSMQPLDAEGRALQQMRSWCAAMPGEVVSCAGCHEQQSTSLPVANAMAARNPPAAIQPWFGQPRGFDFEVEIQPVLDRFCAGCHDGTKTGRPDFARKSEAEKLAINKAYHAATESTVHTVLTPSFIALHPYVRRPSAESNVRLQVAAEFAADTSPLVQLLAKGHHNVRLDDEAWRRLYAWIDLGAPDHGSWKFSEWGVQTNYYERRLEEYRRGAGRTIDVEQIPPAPPAPKFIAPAAAPTPAPVPAAPAGWPFDAKTAQKMQQTAGLAVELKLPLQDGMTMDFVLIPAGSFVMGQVGGAPDEQPRAVSVIEKPFYMSKREVSNREFQALVDPKHFSGFESWRSIDWRGEGHPLSDPLQPAVRVSWHQARQFCAALAAKTGRPVTLPGEAQWEWACRAGTATPFWYGDTDSDFSKLENLAGREREKMAFDGKPKWFLRDNRSNDGQMVSAPVGSYQANPWGLHDMHGNVAEWTRSAYTPLLNAPPADADPRDEAIECVVRGGSWDDKPNRAGSAFRWKYPAWRQVYNVGFRVTIAPSPAATIPPVAQAATAK